MTHPPTSPPPAGDTGPDERRIEEIRARLEAATPGPWAVGERQLTFNALAREKITNPNAIPATERTIITAWEHPQLQGPVSIVTIGTSPFFEECAHHLHTDPDDAEFIAHSPDDVRYLLDRLADLARAAARAERAEAGEEFRVTEDVPGDVRLCRIRVAEDECQGCVALLGDADQRPALEYLAQAGNRLTGAGGGDITTEREIVGGHALGDEADIEVAIAGLAPEWLRVRSALSALVRQEPLYARYIADDDVSILQCVYCAGMEEGDVFVHIPACPWLRSRNLLAGAVAGPGGSGRGEG